MNILIKHNYFKMAIQKVSNSPIKKVYKNLYFDSTDRRYYFIDNNDRRQVVSQEGYLLIYILEVLLGGRK